MSPALPQDNGSILAPSGVNAQPVVRQVTSMGGSEWDVFVDRAPGATFAHACSWRDILAEAYGLRSFQLAAFEGPRLTGVLPLALTESRLFGRHLVSMPYLDYGGVCADGSPAAERALVEEAMALADRERAVLQLREVGERELELACSLDKVTMVLDMGQGEQDLWNRLPSRRRGQVRKGRRNGLTASLHGAEGLADFYRVYATNMRDLGSPAHRLGFFRAILRGLGERAQLILVRANERVVGAGLIVLHRETIALPFVSSLRSSFSLAPNQILYWEAMRFGIANGYRLFDFGRSSKGAGTFEWKREWGAQPVQLHWYHHSPGGGSPHEHVERMGWAPRVWQRLPVSVATRVGSAIRGGIPN
jgi:FemAB-related protein (PEP-CTERM system-associated)